VTTEMNNVLVMSVPLASIDRNEFGLLIQDHLSNKGKLRVAKINTEYLMRSLRNKDFADLLRHNDLNIVDGRGVLWASKYLSLPVSRKGFVRVIQSIFQLVYSGAAIVFNPAYIKQPITDSFPGIDAMRLMLEAAIAKGVSVYIFGAQEAVLERAVRNLRTAYPGLLIAGYHHGYGDGNAVVEDINESGAKMLFVALGSPKQEYWIQDNVDKLTDIKVVVAEGGTLDRLASPRKVAPRWLNHIGLEWLWRLFVNRDLTGEKSRFKRVWNAVPVFIYRTLIWKISHE